ncbi:MAG: hypothetical protein ACM3SP_03015 [Chloroflexota bacterium]
MSRTIGRVAGESDITAGIQTKGLGSANGSRNANASRADSIIKSKLVLLLTRDIELEQQFAVAAAGSSARLIVARTLGVALEIIHQRDRQLELVVIDFDNGTDGILLLRALTTSSAELPVVALTSSDSDDSTVLACDDANVCCLTKSIKAVELVSRVLGRSRPQAGAAQSKQRIKPRVSKLRHTSRTRGAIVRRVKEQTSLRTEA